MPVIVPVLDEKCQVYVEQTDTNLRVNYFIEGKTLQPKELAEIRKINGRKRILLRESLRELQ